MITVSDLYTTHSILSMMYVRFIGVLCNNTAMSTKTNPTMPHLMKAGLKVKPDKCSLLQRSVHYLG